jgi:hypothetical protein
MENEKIDLSPLDPSADAARWERLVGSITEAGARAIAARLRPHPILVQLAAWWRPVVAASAVAVGCAWLPPLVTPAPSSLRTSSTTELAQTASSPTPALMEWAMREKAPSTAELLETFGGSPHGRATP